METGILVSELKHTQEMDLKASNCLLHVIVQNACQPLRSRFREIHLPIQ